MGQEEAESMAAYLPTRSLQSASEMHSPPTAPSRERSFELLEVSVGSVDGPTIPHRRRKSGGEEPVAENGTNGSSSSSKTAADTLNGGTKSLEDTMLSTKTGHGDVTRNSLDKWDLDIRQQPHKQHFHQQLLPPHAQHPQESSFAQFSMSFMSDDDLGTSFYNDSSMDSRVWDIHVDQDDNHNGNSRRMSTDARSSKYISMDSIPEGHANMADEPESPAKPLCVTQEMINMRERLSKLDMRFLGEPSMGLIPEEMDHNIAPPCKPTRQVTEVGDALSDDGGPYSGTASRCSLDMDDLFDDLEDVLDPGHRAVDVVPPTKPMRRATVKTIQPNDIVQRRITAETAAPPVMPRRRNTNTARMHELLQRSSEMVAADKKAGSRSAYRESVVDLPGFDLDVDFDTSDDDSFHPRAKPKSPKPVEKPQPAEPQVEEKIVFEVAPPIKPFRRLTVKPQETFTAANLKALEEELERAESDRHLGSKGSHESEDSADEGPSRGVRPNIPVHMFGSARVMPHRRITRKIDKIVVEESWDTDSLDEVD